MAEITYEVVKALGVIGQGGQGWTKEINLVSWNERPPKFDIRDWDENHEKMRKGITLTKEEALALRDVLNEIDWDSIDY